MFPSARGSAAAAQQTVWTAVRISSSTGVRLATARNRAISSSRSVKGRSPWMQPVMR